jgi:hypothetical protein
LVKDVPGVAALGDAEEDASCAETLDDSEEDVSGAGVVEDPDEHDVSSSTSMASSASMRPVEYADPETNDINFPIRSRPVSAGEGWPGLPSDAAS